VRGFKPKDYIDVPGMLGRALQEDGWWWRSDIVWAKGISFCKEYSGACMPESVRDRPTRSSERVLLLAKSARYYYDQEAEREAAGYDRKGGDAPYLAGGSATHGIGSKSLHQMAGAGRNLRSVWAIGTKGLKLAHYAAFPPDLVRPMIRLGTSERGCCPKCGAGWERMTQNQDRGFADRTFRSVYETATEWSRQGTGATTLARVIERATLGWRPGCAHYDDRYRRVFRKARRARKRRQRDAWAGGWWERVRKWPGLDHWPTEPCVVLDPFVGSGTTAIVAMQLSRRFLGCDLNEDYCQMARKRLRESQLPLFMPKPVLVLEPEQQEMEL